VCFLSISAASLIAGCRSDVRPLGVRREGSAEGRLTWAERCGSSRTPPPSLGPPPKRTWRRERRRPRAGRPCRSGAESQDGRGVKEVPIALFQWPQGVRNCKRGSDTHCEGPIPRALLFSPPRRPGGFSCRHDSPVPYLARQTDTIVCAATIPRARIWCGGSPHVRTSFLIAIHIIHRLPMPAFSRRRFLRSGSASSLQVARYLPTNMAEPAGGEYAPRRVNEETRTFRSTARHLDRPRCNPYARIPSRRFPSNRNQPFIDPLIEKSDLPAFRQ